MKRAFVAAFAASLLAGSAFAQPATTPSTPVPSGMPPEGTTGGIRAADTATMAVRFVALKPADLMSSKVMGTKVYNNQNESLGDIEDLVIENGKTVTGVVVSVGGFLGMGERYVLIDPSTLVVQQKDGTMKAFINTSKDNLKNAPAFTYSKHKS